MIPKRSLLLSKNCQQTIFVHNRRLQDFQRSACSLFKRNKRAERPHRSRRLIQLLRYRLPWDSRPGKCDVSALECVLPNSFFLLLLRLAGFGFKFLTVFYSADRSQVKEPQGCWGGRGGLCTIANNLRIAGSDAIRFFGPLHCRLVGKIREADFKKEMRVTGIQNQCRRNSTKRNRSQAFVCGRENAKLEFFPCCR